MRIAINGFGRIGRNFLRTIMLDKHARSVCQVEAINIGPAPLESTAYLFKHDTMLGTYPGSVVLEETTLIVDDQRIAVLAANDPEQLPWIRMGIDWVVEASGKFTQRDQAQKHLDAGAHYVLITAPAHDEDATIIPGINDHDFNKDKHRIISLGSCTTNAFVPLLKVLDDSFSIINGFMTTIHAYTNSQVLLDVAVKDLRESRAAALNIIPTSTGASKTLGKVLASLNGKIKSRAIRVPVGKVSLIDLVVNTKRDLSAESINKVLNNAAQGDLKGIIGMSTEPLVSSDYSGSPYSVTIDTLLTDAHQTMAHVVGWYDNEWGYSMRLKDFLVRVAKSG